MSGQSQYPFIWSDILLHHNVWLLRYKQNISVYVLENTDFQFSYELMKLFSILSQQPNIRQRQFCISNERDDILYDLKEILLTKLFNKSWFKPQKFA